MSTSDMARRQGDASPLHMPMPMPMSSNPSSRMSAAASRINGTGGFAGCQMGSGSGGIMSSLMGGHSQPGGGIGGVMANRSANANTASTAAVAGRRPMRQARSTPIAIVRNRDDDSDEASGDSIHSDSDDDGSSVDVERDALRIRRRYQKKLGAQAASELSASPSASANTNTNLWGQSKSLNTNTNNGMLRAPYLGSMRQTEDYVAHHDMPPMSLSSDAFTQYQGQRQSGGEMNDDDDHNHNHIHHSGQALEAVGETGANGAAYGSLRESHQQGRFLDGPASYRDPASGQIRQLQSRAQFIHGSLPNTISLRDRIQQSTKLRNIQRKKQAHLNASMPTQRAEEANDDMNNVDDDQQQNQQQQQLQKPGISSLSAMMSKAGKPSRKDDADTEPSDYSGDSETEEHRHIHSTIKRVDSNPYDNDFGQKSDSSPGDLDGMLSTSMTAFEMLREVKANSERAASILHRHHHNYQRQAIGGGINNNDNVNSSHDNNDDTNSTNKNINMSALLCPSSSMSSSNKPDFSQDTRFKELSRSLSDPTPHLRSYRTIMGNLMQSHRSPPAAVMSQQPPIQSMQQLQLNAAAAASQHVSSTTIHQSTNTAGRINATSTTTNQQQYGVFGSISYQQNNSPPHNTMQEQQMMTNREYHASSYNNSGAIDNDEHFDLEME
mmetsp:Transcript_8881/g.25600  ORF Transcript_8881/g.25600 Transcript_8881/m.25600 type:complete len:666 (+) Transcript_8881:333-2330(+)